MRNFYHLLWKKLKYIFSYFGILEDDLPTVLDKKKTYLDVSRYGSKEILGFIFVMSPS